MKRASALKVPCACPKYARIHHMRNHSRSRWGGVLFGVGLMAAVDEIIFHQLLGWHHFYDGATPAIGLLSDGLLHAGGFVAVMGGFFLWRALLRQHALHFTRVGAGGCLGACGFQSFDGIINPRLLRLHQIRYDVPLMPYDGLWNMSAILRPLIGICLL